MLNKKIYTIAFSDFCEPTEYQHYIWEGDGPEEPSDEEFLEAVKVFFREQNKNKKTDVWKKAYIKYLQEDIDLPDVYPEDPSTHCSDLYKAMEKRKFRKLDLKPIKFLVDGTHSDSLPLTNKTEIAEYFGENWLKAVEEVENSVTLLELKHNNVVKYYLAPCDPATYKRRILDYHNEKPIELLLATSNMSEDGKLDKLATGRYLFGGEEVMYFDLKIKPNLVLDLDENYFPKDKGLFLELLGETWYNEYMKYLNNKERKNNNGA